MSLAINAVALLVCVGCMFILLTHPIKREKFFLKRRIWKSFFPKLDSYRLQKQLALFVGLLLATILTCEIMAFLIKYLNQH